MGYSNIQFTSGTTFLVTGGAGFIGSNLCEAITKMGYQVRCLDNFSTGKKKNISEFHEYSNFELFEGDIRNYDTCLLACKDIDFVLHQAAWGSVPRSIEMPLLYEDINVKGTLNMLEAARQCNVIKFVYASSSSVYGDNLDLPKREGNEGKPLSPYALTKQINEDYAALYTNMYGLETYGLRYFNVFGKRQNPDGPYAAVIPKFIFSLLQDEAPIIFGNGIQSRDFTFIDNVVEANLKACMAPSEYSGQSFNIAYGRQTSLLSVYDTICKLLNKNINPIYAYERIGEIKHSYADITKANNVFGYSPEYGINDGIQIYVDWCRG